jgi:VWFA-related protein
MMRPTAILAVAALLASAQQSAQPPRFQDSGLKISVTTNLVIVNVDIRDKSGKPIEGLKASDFILTEDDKQQKLSVFEFQKLEVGAEPLPANEPGPAVQRIVEPKRQITPSKPGEIRYRDRRLLVFFFDFSSMPTEDQFRAQAAALKFLDKQMTPSDLVSIMAFSTKLQVLQDFTDDREALRSIIKGFHLGEGSDLAGLAATGEDSTEDNGSAFTADDTEFNVFNTDRKLSALESAAKMLASLPEKKAVIYFSSGVNKTGMENNSQLQATTNAAVKANVSFYPIDARGLTATAPAGNASSGSPRGTALYSGGAQASMRGQQHDSQETLVTLAGDTGGKALLDNSDLGVGIQAAQKDQSSYYILGYYSSNDALDGRFRRIKVRMADAKLQAKLSFRTGYFAGKEFKKYNTSEKERQLEEAIMLGDPMTELPLALEANYFRIGKATYFVPVAVKIPGSAIETIKKGTTEEKVEFDFIAQLRDKAGKLVGTVRDGVTVKLKGDDAGGFTKRNLEYDSGFTVPPGDYTVKFLARENVSGKMGTFEAKFNVPDAGMQSQWLHTSSVVWSNQRQSMSAAVASAENNKKALANHPLIQDGQKLIPSITRVYRKNQSLYVYLEVYDPAVNASSKTPDILASVSFYRGAVRAFQTEAVRVQSAANSKGGVSVPVKFEIPLSALRPGSYTAQVSLVDGVGQKFAFARSPMVVLNN